MTCSTQGAVTEGANAMLTLEAISLIFADGTAAVRDATLSLPPGQFCVLLGPSGAGKSSLLRMVNGLARPSRGHIVFDGANLSAGDMRGRGEQVATVHQGVDLVPRLSVLDNVLTGALGQLPFWRAALGCFGEALRRRACVLLDRVGLDAGQMYRRASTLSGGQQQRVGIARAFITSPRLVLADEPVASLDPRTSGEILTLLRDAAREQNATVLCSLHQVELARDFADRIIGMRAGQIVLDTTPAALTDDDLQMLYADAGDDGIGDDRQECAA